MIIRPAIWTDLDVCLGLDHDNTTDHVWQMKAQESESAVGATFYPVRLPRQMHVPYPRALEQLTDDWQRGEGFFVAEVDGEVRGYVDLITQRWQQLGWVVNLAVDRDFRRRKIGTGLVQHARQWAKQQGLKLILAEVTTKNYPAIRFYQKLGFQFSGFSDHYYVNGDIALFFVLAMR